MHLSGSEFGDGLGTFGDGVFGQFTWKYKSYRGLDFAGRKGGFLVVSYKFTCFFGDFSEDVVDEGVHDGHTFLGHTGVWVYLFQDFVDVDRETFGPAAAAFAGATFLCGFLCWSFGHFDLFICFYIYFLVNSFLFSPSFVSFLFLFYPVESGTTLA